MFFEHSCHSARSRRIYFALDPVTTCRMTTRHDEQGDVNSRSSLVKVDVLPCFSPLDGICV
jgi:hypothetical protein